MNYKKIYESLIKRAKNSDILGYSEKHHIIPKCMGGTDENYNIVKLTPEEHFFAHILLVKMFPEEKNLIIAVNKMCVPISGRKKRRLYGWLRRKFSDRMKTLSSGKGNSQFGSMWITNGVDDRKITKGNPIDVGWYKGRKSTLKTKTKNPLKRCIVCNITLSSRRNKFCQSHLKENRLKAAERFDRSKSSVLGKKFITNGKYDKLHDIKLQIPEGWFLGRSKSRWNNVVS